MLYYLQTNIIAIIVGIILLAHSLRNPSKLSTSQIIMRYMFEALILYSLFDMLAYIMRGSYYWSVQLANIFCFVIMSLGLYLWFIFIITRVDYIEHLQKAIIITSGPIVLLNIGFLTNPITGFFFTVDDKMLYHRSNGIILIWIVEWLYVFAALFVNIKAIKTEKNRSKKSEYKGYIVFMFPIAVAAITQMLFYGTTTTQIGYMIAVMLVYLNNLHFQVNIDGLTGLNNKSSFLSFRDSLVESAKASDLTLFMIDADYFKQINDKYGHLKGDQALCDIAEILNASTASYSNSRLTVYRYGGDEFAVVGKSLSEEEIGSLIDSINKELVKKNEMNKSDGEQYELSLSIGYAQKSCKHLVDLDELMKMSDEAMYAVKTGKKANRV